tara:strand:+ start:338 stop:712 length:375 start_codon:yes stop_codon:yes gene_type:complete
METELKQPVELKSQIVALQEQLKHLRAKVTEQKKTFEVVDTASVTNIVLQGKNRDSLRVNFKGEKGTYKISHVKATPKNIKTLKETKVFNVHKVPRSKPSAKGKTNPYASIWLGSNKYAGELEE